MSDPCEDKQQAVIDAELNLQIRLTAHLEAIQTGNPTLIAQAWTLVEQALAQLSQATQDYLDCLGVGSGGAD